MTWMNPLKDAWWLLGVLLIIFGALWRLAIKTNKTKERLVTVVENEKSIKALKVEMTDIKGDLSDIKQSVARQGRDTSAILGSLQSIMNALYDSDCNIGPARDKFNDYLSNR